MTGFDKLNREIVSIGLCTDCGTCVGVCPNKCLEMDYELEEPQRVKRCLPGCNLCWEVCPGRDVPMLAFERMLFGRERGADEMLLGIGETFVKCHAVDPLVSGEGDTIRCIRTVLRTTDTRGYSDCGSNLRSGITTGGKSGCSHSI